MLTAIAGGVLAFAATKKNAPSTSDDALHITRVVAIEIIETGKLPVQQFVEIDETIPHTDHLEATVWITKSIHGCLKNQTRQNGKDFFTSAESYLRGKQLDVMRNPSEIDAVKDTMKDALKWFVQNQNLPAKDFAAAFATSGLEIARTGHSRG